MEPEAINQYAELIGNCALCGKARSDLQLHSVINGQAQYLGNCCAGRINATAKSL